MGRRRRAFSDLEVKDIIALYESGISEDSISKRFDCSRTPIIGVLRENSCRIRLPGRKLLPLEELSESSHRKRFHDEAEAFSMEKRGNQGALYLETALKNLDYRQSDINRVFDWYINNWHRYNPDPQHTSEMLHACGVEPQHAEFLAKELNAYVEPKPNQPLPQPVGAPPENRHPQPTEPADKSPFQEKILYLVLENNLHNDPYAFGFIIDAYRRNHKYYHTHLQALAQLINEWTYTERGESLAEIFLEAIPPEEGATQPTPRQKRQAIRSLEQFIELLPPDVQREYRLRLELIKRYFRS